MKRLFAILIIAAACFGQGKQNVVQTGTVDAHGANWRFPESTFAGLPSAASGNTGWRYTVTDCLTSACTAGGGSVQADLRSTGSAWVVISGGGSGGSPMVGAANHVQTTDGAGNPADGGCTMTLATGLNCPPQGGAAAAYAFVQGTSNTPPANSVLIQAPTSVPTAFDITLWSAPTAGFVVASGANPSVLLPRAIAGSDLPNPSASTLGGVESKDCTGSGHILKIGTDGVPVCSADSGSGGTPGGSSGQMQLNSSGSFGGQASVFDAGTMVQTGVECRHGTVSYTALTAAASSQEITILGGTTPLSGNLRYAGVLMSETTQFASTTGLTVSLGRPGSTTHAEMTNSALMPLMVSGSDANFVSTRPAPPIIASTYSLVLNFAVTSGFVNAATAGSLTWEVCAYAAR